MTEQSGTLANLGAQGLVEVAVAAGAELCKPAEDRGLDWTSGDCSHRRRGQRVPWRLASSWPNEAVRAAASTQLILVNSSWSSTRAVSSWHATASIGARRSTQSGTFIVGTIPTRSYFSIVASATTWSWSSTTAIRSWYPTVASATTWTWPTTEIALAAGSWSTLSF